MDRNNLPYNIKNALKQGVPVISKDFFLDSIAKNALEGNAKAFVLATTEDLNRVCNM